MYFTFIFSLFGSSHNVISRGRMLSHPLLLQMMLLWKALLLLMLLLFLLLHGGGGNSLRFLITVIRVVEDNSRPKVRPLGQNITKYGEIVFIL